MPPDTKQPEDSTTGVYWLLRFVSLFYLLSMCCLIPAASGGRFENHATLALLGYGAFLTTELGIRALIHFTSNRCDPWWPVSLTSGSRLKGLPVWVFGVFFLLAGLVNGVRELAHRAPVTQSFSASEAPPEPPPPGQGFEVKVVSSTGTQKVLLLSNYPENLHEIRFDAICTFENSQRQKSGVGFPELFPGQWCEVTGLVAFDQPGSRFASVEIAGKGKNSQNHPIEIRCTWKNPAAQQ